MDESINASEGQRCFLKAKQYVAQGNIQQADRLCTKALRMVPSGSSIANEIRAYQSDLKNTQQSKPEVQAKNVRQRHLSRAKNNQSGEQTSDAWDPNLESKCRLIVSSKNYYEILNVDRIASQEDIKKAYRKLALQYHPDKARCPSAEAAFKQISKAYQCLSNEQAKKHYDTHGFEESESVRQQQQYEAQFMTPEELFESFFHTAFSRGPRVEHTTYTFRQSPNSYSIIQLFPLLVIVFLFIISSFINSFNRSPYSLSRTHYYNLPRTSQANRVLYYVDHGFQKSYLDGSRKLNQLEVQIEMSYFYIECYNELEHLYRDLQTLRFYGTQRQYRNKLREIQEQENNSFRCQKLNSLKNHYPRVYESIRQSQGQSRYSVF